MWKEAVWCGVKASETNRSETFRRGWISAVVLAAWDSPPPYERKGKI
jgi:hypothetical protein